MGRLAALAVAVAIASGCSGRDEPSFRPARASAEDREASARGEVRVIPPPAREAAPPAEAAPAEAAPAEAAPAEAMAEAPPVVEVQAQAAPDPRLLNPSQLTERAPAVFVAELDTTAGPVRIEVHRDWSPNGADRFYNLVRSGYFTDVAFFRVIEGFMAQGGIHGNPTVAAAWQRASIPDDPVVQHNTRGMVSFAMAGPGSRTTQFFINLVDNTRLDAMGFSPFGRVLDMAPVDRFFSGYGEGAPGGRGPAQARVQREGNAYLRAEFPQLTYVRSARIVSPEGGGAARGARAPAR